jgi:hypothetical protein
MSFQTVGFDAVINPLAVQLLDGVAPTDVPLSGIILYSELDNLTMLRPSGFTSTIVLPIGTADRDYTFPDESINVIGDNVATLSNLSSVGTITTGVWNGSILAPAYGGTGVNNATSTITLSGNLTTVGANTLTLNTTAATNITLPTTGLVITDAVVSLPSLTTAAALATVGTITTGTWQGSTVAVGFGGTGATSFGAGGILYGNGTSPIASSAAGVVGNLLVSGGAGTPTWSTGVTFSGGKFSGLATPTANGDAATKQYVDEAIAGLSWKQAARIATTVNRTVTYDNGTGGVGATLTNAGAQAILSLDGEVLVVGDRVLVKDQTATLQNGIYTVTNIGSVSTNWVLTRAVDADNQPGNELNSAAIFVTEGSIHASLSYVQTTANVVIGTSTVVWSQFAGTNTYTAGTGLNLTGNQFTLISPVSPILGGTGLTSYTATGSILYADSTTSLASTAAGTATQVLHGGTVPSWSAVSLTADVSGILPIVSGGTNSSTALSSNRVMVSSAGSIVEAAALSNGQLLIGSTAAAPIVANITGTTNQVIVTNGAGSITLSLPQDIALSSSPTFASLNLTAATNQLVLGTTNTVTISAVAPASSRTYSIPEVADLSQFVMTAGVQTIGGAKTFTAVTTLDQAGLTANKPLQLNGTKQIVTGDIALASQVSGVLPIVNGGTNSSAGLNNNRFMVSSAGAIVESAALTDGQLFIGSTGAAAVPTTLTAGTGVTITNAAGSITIESDASAVPQVVSFTSNQITASGTSYGTVGTMPYDHSRFSGLVVRTLTMWVVPGTGSRDLDIQVIDDVGTVLITGTVLVGSGTGIKTFQIVNGATWTDSYLRLQVRRAGGGGSNPEIQGATLEFSTA